MSAREVFTVVVRSDPYFDGLSRDEIGDLFDKAAAALTAAGFTIVPNEPTEAMIKANRALTLIDKDSRALNSPAPARPTTRREDVTNEELATELERVALRSESRNQNTGHGHVYPRPDGNKARCGGPRMCSECALDFVRKNSEAPVPIPGPLFVPVLAAPRKP